MVLGTWHGHAYVVASALAGWRKLGLTVRETVCRRAMSCWTGWHGTQFGY